MTIEELEKRERDAYEAFMEKPTGCTPTCA